MKTTIGSNAKTKIKQALGLFVLAAAFGAQAQQTYTWDGSVGAMWGDSGNWVGDPTLTFNNQTDIIFNDADQVTRRNALSIGGARTIRSLTINANYATDNNATFDIRTYLNFGDTARNLTFAAASGNASITVAQSTSGTVQVRLGSSSGTTQNQGNVVLNSNLDLAQNNTFFGNTGFQFDGPVTGAGTINKTGAGLVRMVRNNENWTGGMNINEGEVSVFANGNAMGTGAWTIGGGANNTKFSVGSVATQNNTGGLVVADGAGTRTIALMSTTAGNSTLAGAITLNKDAIFDVGAYVAGTHDRLTLSNVVSGDGGIVKTNDGILILSAANTNTGTTDIQAGKLYLTGAGRLGSGAVTIASGANLDFAAGNSTTPNIVANNISGDGQIFQNVASSDTRFTGDVTNTGGLTINGGTLRIGNGGTTGSYTGDTVITSGTLAFSRSNAYTHGGTISGAGGVAKVNDGDVTLTGNNSYSGTTALYTGVLVADHATALGTGDITFYSGGGNSGTIRYTANSAATDWATRIVNSAGTIRLDTNGNDVNLAGVIDDSNVYGLVKSGNGTLILGGDNTYTGATTVGAGGLIVGGSLASGSAVTVASGARIGGTGSLAGDLSILSGGLFVFNSADPTLDVAGAVTLDNSFGVDSLVNTDGTAIDWASVSDGTYTLIGDTASTFNTITNFGVDHAKELGDGRKAYFENGSLQLVVIPEPASLGLLIAGVTGLMALRRMTRF